MLALLFSSCWTFVSPVVGACDAEAERARSRSRTGQGTTPFGFRASRYAAECRQDKRVHEHQIKMEHRKRASYARVLRERTALPRRLQPPLPQRATRLAWMDGDEGGRADRATKKKRTNSGLRLMISTGFE